MTPTRPSPAKGGMDWTPLSRQISSEFRTGVIQGATVDPCVVHARGGQKLGKEGPLRIGRGAGAMIQLVDQTAEAPPKFVFS